MRKTQLIWLLGYYAIDRWIYVDFKFSNKTRQLQWSISSTDVKESHGVNCIYICSLPDCQRTKEEEKKEKKFNINHGESMLQYHIRHMKLLKCDENNSLSETCTHNTGFKLNIVWYKLLQKYTSTDKDSLVEVTTHGLGRILFSLLRM